MPIVFLVCNCAATPPKNGDEILAYAPEYLRSLSLEYKDPAVRVSTIQWTLKGPAWLNCESQDGPNMRVEADHETAADIAGLLRLQIKRTVAPIDDIELTEYGFESHGATGYLLYNSFGMDPVVFLLGRMALDNDEIFLLHGGYVVALEAAPFRKLLARCQTSSP